MEKKGDLLNQLAIVSDLMEGLNMDSQSKTIMIEVDDNEFNRVYNLFIQKAKVELEPVEHVFSAKIGEVNIIFSKNSV